MSAAADASDAEKSCPISDQGCVSGHDAMARAAPAVPVDAVRKAAPIYGLCVGLRPVWSARGGFDRIVATCGRGSADSKRALFLLRSTAPPKEAASAPARQRKAALMFYTGRLGVLVPVGGRSGNPSVS